ncbi:hypothetical protein ACP4OV_013144 [Aristida adscensionis]
MTPCVGGGDGYRRPPPKQWVVIEHDKPPSHPQQVRIATVGANEMLISWITDDRSSPSVVEYGTSPGEYTSSATGHHGTYQYSSYVSGAIHHVTIGPLEPGTTYHYRCGLAGDEFSLRTCPATLPVEFVVIGDVGRTGWTVSTLFQIAGGEHDAVLLPGDLSYADGHQERWDTFGRLVQPLASRRPWMVTAGNHEREVTLREPGTDDGEHPAGFVAYDARWRMPHAESGSLCNHYYSFDAAGGAVHVVMLGTYAAATAEAVAEQRAWLERDLAAVDRRRTPWLVALMHAPWYNTNRAHRGDADAEGMRRAMERLLYDSRVDVVFAAHTHSYERFRGYMTNKADSQGPMYITIGDAGNYRAREFISDHELADLSVFREASFGHGRLRILDEKSAVWTWHRNDGEHATVVDEVRLESLATAKFAEDI